MDAWDRKEAPGLRAAGPGRDPGSPPTNLRVTRPGERSGRRRGRIDAMTAGVDRLPGAVPSSSP